MSGNEGVAWARRVVDRGWPRKDAPVSEGIEVYEDLAAAYETLAADAADHGHEGSALAFRDLAEHAQRFAQKLRADEPWRWLMGRVDLDDTSRCPLADVCAGCGFPVSNRCVWTAMTGVGVMCLTLCEFCEVFGAPRMSLPEAVRAVMRHCEHLGVTVDDMAEQIEAESEQERR